MRNAAGYFNPTHLHATCGICRVGEAFGRAQTKPAASPQLFDKTMFLLEKLGAGERIRTVDPNLGKVMLYP